MSTDDELTKYEPFSNKKMIAYSLNLAILNTFWAIRNNIQLYALKAIGIPILYVLIIFGIYCIWDAVNDPLTGNLLDRSSKLTSKHGKRFPYIVIGLIGALFCLLLLYIPVTFDPILAVIWILIIIIAYDAFQTLYELSFAALNVDRMRDQKQRVKFGTYSYIFYGVFALTFAITNPLIMGMFGGVTNPMAFFFANLFTIVILIIIAIPHLLSAREPEEMKELRVNLNEKGKSSSPPKVLIKRALTDKNWMAVVLVYSIYVIAVSCTVVGTTFYILDGLGLTIEWTAITGITFFVTAFIMVPIWMKIARKIGTRKAFNISLILIVISTACFIFAVNFSILVLIYIFFAVGVSGASVMLNALFSEAIDNATLKHGTREESSYLGILRFFSATAIFWQILVFAIVTISFGYDATLGTDNSPTAKLGLLLQISLIPSIIMLIGTLIFIKFHDISKDRAIDIKKRLIEMNL